MKAGDVVLVEWLDSQHTQGWQLYEDLKEDPAPMLIKSVGFLMEKTKDRIVFCQSLDPNNFENKKGNIDAIMEVPMCSVKSVKKV